MPANTTPKARKARANGKPRAPRAATVQATPEAAPAPVEELPAVAAEAIIAEPVVPEIPAEPSEIEAPVAEVTVPAPEIEASEPEVVATEAIAAEIEAPVPEIAEPETEMPVAEIETAPASAETEITPPTTPPPSAKEKIMSTTPSFDFSVFQTAFSDLQAKSKAALEKSTAAFGDYKTFTKGNVEALVEAGKILSAGLQELSTGAVAESRSAFETLTAEVKELASAKSPTEFLRLQSELAKKHIDHAVALGSKQSEAVLKLATDVAAPVSNRVAVTVSKLQKVA